MNEVLLRRKRLVDGTFGELENVFGGETDAEKIERLESENKRLQAQLDNAVIELSSAMVAMIGGGAGGV